MNLTLHYVASVVGTELAKGAVTIEALATELTGTDGMSSGQAKAIVRRFIGALRTAGLVRCQGNKYVVPA